jgi:GntR family transcriptional regulator / MocR family aminotransferase
MGEPSQPIELLLTVTRDGPETLGAQIETQLRTTIRDGTLRAGTRLPSTRDLARQLGVSRRVVVDAYAQLSAEGYVALRQRARPQVAENAVAAAPLESEPPARYDFRPSVPDVSTFPRAAWLRSMKAALSEIADADLAYRDANGVEALRSALAGYLARVRGVAAEPARVIVTSGYTQGLGIVCRALAAAGATRMALEDPGDPEAAQVAARAGLTVVAVPVDEHGVDVERLARASPDAVVLTPAHHHPTGVVLSAERRDALHAWLQARDAIAIEDDYDAEYRYDRAALPALQGRDPGRIVYAGTASKVLAPALRIGWLVVPPRLLDGVAYEKLLADRGTARIEQLAFAHFLTTGGLDRHLRQMRKVYRARRDALVAAVAEELPGATVRGIAAGLHATVELPRGCDEAAIRTHARERHVDFEVLGDYRLGDTAPPPALLLGYANLSEPAIRAGIRTLATGLVHGSDPGSGQGAAAR